MKSHMLRHGRPLPIPDHMPMSRREAPLSVEVPRIPRTGAIPGVVDSSGLKMFGEGAWKVRPHEVDKPCTWRKIHWAVDAQARRTSSASKSRPQIGATTRGSGWLDQIPGPIAQGCHEGIAQVRFVQPFPCGQGPSDGVMSTSRRDSRGPRL